MTKEKEVLQGAPSARKKRRGSCREVYPLSRQVVATTAYIMGDSSAAAAALADADAHVGRVNFYIDTLTSSIIVEKLPPAD